MTVESKRRKRRGARASTRGPRHSMTQFVYVVLFFIGLVVVPLVITFIYKVANDPATPGIIKHMWANFKENGFGYLGNDRKKKSRKVK